MTETRFIVQISRTITEYRLVECFARDEKAARRMAVRMARNSDNGGEIIRGEVGEFADGVPGERWTSQVLGRGAR